MYHLIWIAKFRYSASVLGFTKYQMEKIQQKIIGPCLSQACYCNKLPRAIVYGPSKYGGMEWDNILVLLVDEKLKVLIGSIRLQDNVGKMLQIHLSWVQLFAGIITPVLQQQKHIHYLPLGWLSILHRQLIWNKYTS